MDGDVRYDPAVIQRYANGMYAQATQTVIVFTVVGLAIGAVALYLVGREPGLLIGGIVGAVVGYLYGEGRASALRLAAQTALCQVAIEANTRPAIASGRSRVDGPSSWSEQASHAPAERASRGPAAYGSWRVVQVIGFPIHVETTVLVEVVGPGDTLMVSDGHHQLTFPVDDQHVFATPANLLSLSRGTSLLALAPQEGQEVQDVWARIRGD